jgi:hypothetical protein
LLFLCQISFGQTVGEKLLHGKIVVESGNVAGVNIVNLVNEKNATSDSNGDFFILAKADDLLVFSSVNLEYQRKIIDEDDITSDIIAINMTSKITQLKEVIINKHPQINPVSLGISPKGIKKYTPAERRLKTAGDFKPIHLLQILGGSMPVDPILNAISGRTEMLKKELELERKEHLLILFSSLLDEKYFSNTLKIDKHYIKGFQYYCLEDGTISEALKSKNKTKIEFLIVPLAANYNEIMADETK